MGKKQGNLSINSENIFPIIKKWLYSDHDIFVRELVSNGCDAITKLKKLSLIGEAEVPDDEKYSIQVLTDAENKTITFIDNGIGMTMDEVDEYINQIAFSGAEAFLNEYKDKTSEDQIIGHFGLGFYSAFMVADRVTIETLSYKGGAEAVFWDCEEGTEFSMETCERSERGTKITLYLNEDSVEFSNLYRVEEVLKKYCSFMPVEIFLSDPSKEPEYETIMEEEVKEDDTVVEHIVEPAKTEEKENEDGTKETVEVQPEKKKAKIIKRPVSVSDTSPLWNKHPNECTDEEYKAFYRKVFNDYREPLFWIHLNMDYPFNLKGILYFPKINMEYDSIEGTVKLYNNQVFIADNIKEVIPEYLLLLRGVIDCPDLPLNVSRSALQNDGFVKKISDYITKKVSDKLSGMCKTDRENYEKYWDDISPFIKYGCLKDEKFCEKMSDYVLFKNIDSKYLTFKDCLDENKEKHENMIFYTDDAVRQSQYINMYREEEIDVVILNEKIDQPFVQHLESKNENVKFKRVDDDLNDTFTEKLDENEEKKYQRKLSLIFRKALDKAFLEVKATKMKDDKVSAMITLSEESRRMMDMMKMYGMSDANPAMFGASGETLTLNTGNALVKYLLDNVDIPELDAEDEDKDNTEAEEASGGTESAEASSEEAGEQSEYDDETDADKDQDADINVELNDREKMVCMQLYDLALLSYGTLDADSMTAFVERSNKRIELAIEK